MKTKAAVLYNTGEPLRIEELTVPTLEAGQALVDVAFSGVCHTQLHEVRGRRGEDRFLPHTLGHEGAGIVREVGPGVTKVKAGDPVVLSWIKGRGADVRGATYRLGERAINSGPISTFMSHTVIAENRLTPISSEMPLEEAALLGCAVPTGAGIILNTARVQPGRSVVVFGAGGIGLCAIMGAAFAEANPIIAVDIVERKLELARAVGATHTIDARSADPIEAVRALTGGAGADYAVETAGRKETMEAAHRSVRDGGGLCVLAGNLALGDRIAVDPMDLIRGKHLRGTWGGETEPDRDIPLYVRLFLERRLNLSALLTRTYALDQVNEALDDLERGAVARALLDCSV